MFVETNGAHQFFNCTILAENAETRGKGLAGRHQRRAKHHQSVFNHLNFTTDLGSQSPLITTSSTFHLILAFSFLFRSSRFVLFIVFFLFPFFFSFFLFFCVFLYRVEEVFVMIRSRNSNMVAALHPPVILCFIHSIMKE